MGAIGIIFFSASFVTVSIYFGKLYKKFNIDRETWFVVMVVSLALFVAGFVYENFIQKKQSE